MDSIAAGVVLASGYGSRVGAKLNKVFLPLAGRTLVSWSLNALGSVPGIGVLVLVIRPQDAEHARAALAGEVDHAHVELVHGGATRQESELMALRHLAPRIGTGEIDTVLIHDAARPLVSAELAGSVLATARATGGAIPGLPRTDLIAADATGERAASSPLTGVVTVQTPQGFRARPLLAAYERAAAEGFDGTDTAACMARFSAVGVRCIPGEDRNFKVTYPHDLARAAELLSERRVARP